MRAIQRHMASATATLVLCAVMVESQTRATLPAVQATTETTYTLGGGRVYTVPGHYYRSQDGREREDFSGGSTIADTGRGTITLLRHDTKEAIVFKVRGPHAAAPRERTASPAPHEHGIHESRLVSKTRVEVPGGKRHEVWTATDIGLIVFSQIETPGLTATKRLRNVLVGEPDPSVFKVPLGYAVKHQALDGLGAESVPAAAGSPGVQRVQR